MLDERQGGGQQERRPGHAARAPIRPRDAREQARPKEIVHPDDFLLDEGFVELEAEDVAEEGVVVGGDTTK